MKNWITVLLLLQMCLFKIISDVPADTTVNEVELKDDIILSITETTTEETTEDVEDSLNETEPPTEPLVVETEPTTPNVTETEPAPTEQEIASDGLVSLGTFKITAYCSCYTCCGEHALNRPVDEYGNEIVYGSIGVRLTAGVSIAVDPRVIPYGTSVVINGHKYIAQDTGGAISGNRIDVYFNDHQEAREFGVKHAEVFVYG